MELILILFLILAVSGLFAIKKQRENWQNRFSQRKPSLSKKDYLESIKEAGRKRSAEEAAEQAYKNNIKKDYLG